MKRYRVALFVVYCVITIALMAELIYSAFFSLEKQYIARMEETATQVSGGIVGRMNDSLNMLKVVSLEFEEYDDIHCQESVDKLTKMAGRTQFTRMWLTKASGDAVSSDDKTAKANGREYLKLGLEGKSGISDVQTSNISNEKNVVLYTPIYHEDEITGLLIGIYALEELQDMIVVQSFNGEGSTSVFLSDGEIIVGTDDATMSKETNVFTFFSRQKIRRRRTMDDIQSDIHDMKSGVATYLGEKSYHYAYYCPIGLSDWYLLIRMPEGLVANDFVKLVRSSLFVSLALLGVTMVPYSINMRTQSKELRRLAHTDSLTGLLNRGAIEDAVNEKMKGDPDKVYALLVMDIDNFKSINDRHGHIVGDKVLKKIAGIMRMEFTYGLIGRLGGDEFSVLIPLEEYFKENPETNVLEYIGKFADKLRKVNSIDGQSVEISASIGVSFSKKDGNTFNSLYLKADERMYSVKERGKDGIA